ncbi:MAG TPA: tRNA (N6-isopentenyl adenosine(37)-C2)-methylthiotransferase MiaB [Candidatus Polarisedimenticolaceae bacterium]|nr:tRNA (N6-isopentenyl adenosine(37)-C2)-methylthiotransferase MiaB [Candidatus Polarisedimenticolaceae bacterium]
MSAPGGRLGRYFIETWGCQMNVLDADKTAGALESHGYARAASAEDADVVLLNTCSIREKAQEKVFSELGRLKPLKDRRPGLVLGVCGCVAQQEGAAIFGRAPYVDFVVGTRATRSIPLLVDRLRAGDESARHVSDTALRDDSIEFPYDRIRREIGGAAKAFVTIIEGCNHRCSFCIVPRTRGRESSRDMDDVLDEVRALGAKGFTEIEFLGQTVNAYRDARGRTLGDLLRAAARIDGITRLRFTTSHPAQMTAALMDAMADARPVLCPYLHLPVQSGSSSVLRAMRRGYDRAGYLGKVAALRERIPGLCLGTDVIVGFPTETDADFEETLSLLEEVEFDTVYSFAYSARPGTTAAALGPDLSAELKFGRLARLQGVQREIQERRSRRWVDRDVEVLVEEPNPRRAGGWTGRTPEARIVHFDGPSAPGRLERIRITQSGAFSLRGTMSAGA